MLTSLAFHVLVLVCLLCSCNGYWDNGTPIEYQSSQGTWLNSIQVYNGFSVTTATQCNDDYTYDTINYKDVVTSDSGCVVFLAHRHRKALFARHASWKEYAWEKNVATVTAQSMVSVA